MKFPAICEESKFWWEDWAMPPYEAQMSPFFPPKVITLFLYDGTWSPGKKKGGWMHHNYTHTYPLPTRWDDEFTVMDERFNFNQDEPSER